MNFFRTTKSQKEIDSNGFINFSKYHLTKTKNQEYSEKNHLNANIKQLKWLAYDHYLFFLRFARCAFLFFCSSSFLSSSLYSSIYLLLSLPQPHSLTLLICINTVHQSSIINSHFLFCSFCSWTWKLFGDCINCTAHERRANVFFCKWWRTFSLNENKKASFFSWSGSYLVSTFIKIEEKNRLICG